MIGVEPKHTFKFLVIGPSGVGKTSLLKRLIDDDFNSSGTSTIGVAYLSAVMEIDGQPIKLQFWDTAGQEKFRAVTKSYFRNAVGVCLVYDITDRGSFDDLGFWLNDVHALCDPNAAIILIGNKLDLAGQRVVTTGEAQTFAGNHQLMFLETSARDGDNVLEAFRRAAQVAYERAEAGKLQSIGSPKKNGASITSVKSGRTGKGCPC
jgi:small GTP-binding protein